MFSAAKSGLASPMARAGEGTERQHSAKGTAAAGENLSSLALGTGEVVLVLLGWFCAQANSTCQGTELIIPGTVPG